MMNARATAARRSHPYVATTVDFMTQNGLWIALGGVVLLILFLVIYYAVGQSTAPALAPVKGIELTTLPKGSAEFEKSIATLVNENRNLINEDRKTINSLVDGQKVLSDKVKEHDSAIKTNQDGLKAAIDALNKSQTQQGVVVRQLSEREKLIEEINSRLKVAPPLQLQPVPKPLSSLGDTGNFHPSSVG